MDKQKISRQQLEQIIREEIMTNEGFLDRVMSKAKGNTSALKALGQRGVQAVKLAATGKVDMDKIQDPKLVKIIATAVHRINSYEKKFGKLLSDFTNDLEVMFGGDLGKAPQIKSLLDRLDNSATQFAKQLGDIGKEIQSKVTQQNTQSSEPESDTQSNQSEPATNVNNPGLDQTKISDKTPDSANTTYDKAQVQKQQSQRFNQQRKQLGSDNWKTF